MQRDIIAESSKGHSWACSCLPGPGYTQRGREPLTTNRRRDQEWKRRMKDRKSSLKRIKLKYVSSPIKLTSHVVVCRYVWGFIYPPLGFPPQPQYNRGECKWICVFIRSAMRHLRHSQQHSIRNNRPHSPTILKNKQTSTVLQCSTQFGLNPLNFRFERREPEVQKC